MSSNGTLETLGTPEPGDAHPLLEKTHGKQSVIYAHCIERAKRHQRCIWLCRRQNRHAIAWDVPLDDLESNNIDLKSQNKWWNRYSFYNIIGVQHVKIKFLSAKKDGGAFHVIARVVDNTTRIAKRQRCLDNFRPMDGCGVSIAGHRHDEEERYCENWEEDEYSGGCRVINYFRIKHQIKNLKWMPAMLDYYWQSGIDTDGLRFLERDRFVLKYDYLAEERYLDAEDPYGKSVHALELVSGWRIRRLLCAFLAAGVLDLGVIAITILLSGSVNTGLAAGSYAVGTEALLLAFLTMLSAVLP